MARMQARIIAALFPIAAALPGVLPAQEIYPSKPIRVIVPMPPGSGIDLILRRAGADLGPRMGQPWIVENRPGASSVVVGEACAKAAPDGYTLCNANFDMLSNNPHVFAKLPYDAAKDFKPVTNLYFLIEGVFAKSSLPVATVAELKALALSRPDGLNFGTFGPNTNPDLFLRWLNGAWNTRVVGIPYKGGNLIIAALAAGEIDLAKIGAYNAIPQMKGGKVKLLALTSEKRLRLHPDVPTVAEVGLDGYPIRGWQGLVAPAGVGEAVARRVSAEFVKLFAERAFSEFLDTQYLEPAVGTPEEFARFLEEDRDRAGALARRFNVPRQ